MHSLKKESWYSLHWYVIYKIQLYNVKLMWMILQICAIVIFSPRGLIATIIASDISVSCACWFVSHNIARICTQVNRAINIYDG